MRRRIDKIAPLARLREASRSELTRFSWVYRVWALRAGELIGLGDDVFFLTIPEVLNALAGEEQALAYVPARKETHRKYESLPHYPPIINGRFDPFQWAADPNRRSDIFDSHAPIPLSDSDSSGPNPIIGITGAVGQI